MLLNCYALTRSGDKSLVKMTSNSYSVWSNAYLCQHSPRSIRAVGQRCRRYKNPRHRIFCCFCGDLIFYHIPKHETASRHFATVSVSAKKFWNPPHKLWLPWSRRPVTRVSVFCSSFTRLSRQHCTPNPSLGSCPFLLVNVLEFPFKYTVRLRTHLFYRKSTQKS